MSIVHTQDLARDMLEAMEYSKADKLATVTQLASVNDVTSDTEGLVWFEDTGQMVSYKNGASSLDSDVYKHLRLAIEFFKASFESRQLAILNGGTPFLPKLNFEASTKVNGATHTELQAAIDFANTTPPYNQSRYKIVLVDTVITLGADITIPSDVLVACKGAGKIVSDGTYKIIVSSKAVLAALDLVNCPLALATTTKGASKARIIGCRSTGIINGSAKSFIYDGRTVDNTLHESVIIALNEVDGPDIFAWGQFMSGWSVMYNKFRGTPGVGRFLRASGGVNNTLKYNLIDGCIAGVTTLLDKTQSIGWTNNDVSCNYLKNVTEEAISIDCYGNVADKMSILERVIITATSGSYSTNPKLQFARTSLTSLTYSNYIAGLVMTGSMAGRLLDIVAFNTISAGVTYDIQLRNRTLTSSELAGLVGASIAIVIRADSNIYNNNIFYDCYRPIYLWGSGWNNLIDGNVVRKSLDFVSDPEGDINIIGVGGLNPTDTAYPGQCYIAPANNVVSNNHAVVGIAGRIYGTAPAILSNYVAPMPVTLSNNTHVLDAAWRMYNNTNLNEVIQGAVITSREASGVLGDFDFMLPTNELSAGTYTANGTGVQTVFNIPHLLSSSFATGWNPTRFTVIPGSQAAAAAFYVTTDATNLVVTFSAAPAAGTGNVVLTWSAEA